jgi:CubicO group peptidase (beta-lactamase class C family)
MLLWILLSLVQDDAARIRALLEDRLAARRGTAMAAGVVDAGGRVSVGAGSLRKDAAEAVDGRTLFEIGSITKTFTALLLAEMAGRGELRLEDPAGSPALKVPARNGRVITLLDLARHRSGLPRMPDNFAPADPLDPYADYGADRLHAFLDGHVLGGDIDAGYEYSNLGYGLLGHALALRRGKGYEALLRERVLDPIGLADTVIAIPEAWRPRLARPYAAGLVEVKNWDLGGLAGAGDLRSTAEDVLKYLAAQWDGPLAKAAAETRGHRKPTGMAGLEIALGWHVKTQNGRAFFIHSGGTGGYRSFAGFDPEARRGVVVLANGEHGVDDLGLHLLDPKSPLSAVARAVEVDAAALDRCIGTYQLSEGFHLTITREGTRLYGRATGQERFPLTALAGGRFVHEDARIELRFAEGSPAPSLGFRQGPQSVIAPRVDPAKLPPPKARKEIKVDPSILDGLAGTYELTPDFSIAVTREGDRLMTQATGQAKVEIFPESETEWFLKVVEAQLTFTKDAQGKVTGLVLRQAGLTLPGKRK